MENALRAPRDGVVRAVHVAPGDMVAPGRAAAWSSSDREPTRARDGGRGRAARRPAERGDAAVGRRPRGLLRRASSPRACRSSRRAPSSRRSGCRRWPAPTRCSGGCRRAARRPPARARPEPPGLRPRPREPGRARSPSSRRPARRSTAGTRTPPSTSRSPASRSSCRRRSREGLWVRGYVSTCFGCPYEGAVPPARVVDVARRLAAAGCDEVSIGDTIGVAVPTQVTDVFGRLRGRGARRVSRRALPRHPRDRARQRARRARRGHRDRSTARPAASAAARTRRARPATSPPRTCVYMLDGMGIETGVDLAAVALASRSLASRLGRTLPSRWLQAGPFVPQGSGA